MRALRSWPVLLGTLVLARLPAPAGAQPVGEEFQVNTYTTSGQRTLRADRSVAAAANGNFIVVWSGSGQGDGSGIFGQRYDSEGARLGGEFRVNSSTTRSQYEASVASDTSGNFIVVWQASELGESKDIFGQRYDSGGVAQGDEFRISSYTTYFQGDSSIASDASGNFVVVWARGYKGQKGNFYHGQILGRRYDSEGVPQGGEFLVNTSTDSFRNPSVASDASGNFVVAWEGVTGYGDYIAGVFGQRYDNEGVPEGAEFGISGGLYPSVASDAGGNFVVVWYSNGDIFGQRYDSAGDTLGNDFRVNSYLSGSQSFPSVASDTSGNFMVAWQSDDQDGDDEGVFGQRYNSDGVPLGGEFQINSYTTNSQEGSQVGATGTDQFVVVWTGEGQGDSYGVFGQRFDFAGETITVVSPNTNVRWRIGSLQKIQWTHTLGPNASFRLELDRDDDGDYEELIAAHAHATNATKGSFAWTVTGPPSGTARVRVSWSDDLAVSDASDVTFQIRPGAFSATETLLQP